MDTQFLPLRSEHMRRIRQFGTKPEMIVRKSVWSLGYRYRLHRKILNSRPDLSLVAAKKVILVHGCFWHRHQGCKKSSTPSTRTRFWSDKFEANVARDRKHEAELVAAGWKVLIVWECETGDSDGLKDRLAKFLSSC